mgnify:CR=1 FL=1
MKKLWNNLLFRVIIAITLGIVLGGILPESIGNIFATFNGLFDQLLKFLIPLIIVGLIIPAISKLGNSAGKMLLTTVAIAYGSSLFSGFSTYFASMSIFPSLIDNQSVVVADEQAISLTPYFTLQIPPFFDVMGALVFSFLIGIGLSRLQNSKLAEVSYDFENIISFIIDKVIIHLLPLFIFGIFLDMTYSGKVLMIVKIIGVIFALHIILLLLQYLIAGFITKKNPLKLLATMMPAYFTALGTQSSAATIPVTLEQAKKNGVSDEIASFVIPLCATIHLAGSTLKIVACVIALMLMQGLPIDFGLMAGFICMLGVTMIAAPGVPGGAIMAALGIITSMLGFNAENQALMISLYIAMDSFGTACNVTGDGAIALVIDKLFGKKEVV